MKNKFSFDISPANLKYRFANNKIILFFKEENEHITIHFRDNFELLDIHRKEEKTGKYEHLFVAKTEDLISALKGIQNYIPKLLLKSVQPITFEKMKGQNYWLRHNPHITSGNYFENKKIEWFEFENDFIGRSIEFPVEQMEKSLNKNVERTYQIFKGGNQENIGVLFQKATKSGSPQLIFISYKNVKSILREGQEKLLPYFIELHNPEEERKLIEKYE